MGVGCLDTTTACGVASGRKQRGGGTIGRRAYRPCIVMHPSPTPGRGEQDANGATVAVHLAPAAMDAATATHRGQRVRVGQASRSPMLGTRHRVRPETWAWAMPSVPADQRMRVMSYGRPLFFTLNGRLIGQPDRTPPIEEVVSVLGQRRVVLRCPRTLVLSARLMPRSECRAGRCGRRRRRPGHGRTPCPHGVSSS